MRKATVKMMTIHSTSHPNAIEGFIGRGRAPKMQSMRCRSAVRTSNESGSGQAVIEACSTVRSMASERGEFNADGRI